MAVESKASVAAHFIAYNFPSAADFGSLIDSYTDASEALEAIATAARTGSKGLVYVSGASAASLFSAGTVGLRLVNTATTAAALGSIGGTTAGQAVFTASTTAAAQQAMGGSTVGRQVFESANTAAAAAVLSVLATASQAQMEAASTGAVAVTPDVLKYHPAVPKVWLSMDGLGEASSRSSYNISGVVRNGTGDYNASFTTPFSSNLYCVISRIDVSANANNDSYTLQVVSAGVSTMHFRTLIYSTGSPVDCEVIDFTIFGDQ